MFPNIAGHFLELFNFRESIGHVKYLPFNHTNKTRRKNSLMSFILEVPITKYVSRRVQVSTLHYIKYNILNTRLLQVLRGIPCTKALGMFPADATQQYEHDLMIMVRKQDDLCIITHYYYFLMTRRAH